MHEPTHAPGWRGRPASYADLQPSDESRINSLEIFCAFGCVLGAAVAIGAGIYTSVPALIAWADKLL